MGSGGAIVNSLNLETSTATVMVVLVKGLALIKFFPKKVDWVEAPSLRRRGSSEERQGNGEAETKADAIFFLNPKPLFFFFLCSRREMMRSLLRSPACKSLSSSILRRHYAAASDALQSQSQSHSPLESRLRTILRDEIQYQHVYAPPHEAVTEYDRFVVEDRPGQQWITLRSKSGEGENIKIEATMFDGSILGGNEEEEEEEEEEQLHISMLVDIWRGEDSDPMEFICSAWPDSLEIQKVYILNRHHSQPQPYMGPHIKNLNNKLLRTGFYEFLKARGINGDLSKFLHRYMMNKDRIELIRWLGKLQSYFGS